MNYIIFNSICITILSTIYFVINSEDGGFFYILYDGIKKFYLFIICPIIISLLNLIFTISIGEYRYIYITLIPSLIPISIIIYQWVDMLIYEHRYNKYHATVSNFAMKFLKERGVNIENIHINTSYRGNKKTNGKIGCSIYVTICDKDTDNEYKLSKDLEEYLKNYLPSLCFTARIHNKN